MLFSNTGVHCAIYLLLRPDLKERPDAWLIDFPSKFRMSDFAMVASSECFMNTRLSTLAVHERQSHAVLRLV